LLFGKLEKGGLVRVDVKDDKLAFSYPTRSCHLRASRSCRH